MQADLPELSSEEAERTETAHVLTRLAGIRADRLNERDRKDLEALCREIAVAGDVLEAYELDWKRPAAAGPLPAAYRPH